MERPNVFGRYITELRESVNLTEKDVATHLKVTESEVLAWEEGQILPPKNLSQAISLLFRIREEEWLECLTMEIELRTT